MPSAELTSSVNPLNNKADPLKVNESPGDVVDIDIKDDADPTTIEDDIYVDPEYTDEDSGEAEEDEDQEGEVLNWVQSMWTRYVSRHEFGVDVVFMFRLWYCCRFGI